MVDFFGYNWIYVYFCGVDSLNYFLMVLKLDVFHFDSQAKVKSDYSNVLEIDDVKSLDFASLYATLKVLNPRSRFVQFSISTK